MDVITTKTKILAWAVVGDREKIDFDLCDFAPDQVADLDRLIRADGENKVGLTLEPEQKKLQIPAFTCPVRLVSLACRTKGQKLKIADFRSPDERATAIKRMSAADTPILLSIREVQRGLFAPPPSTTSATTPTTEAVTGPVRLAPNLAGLKNCRLVVTIQRSAETAECTLSYEVKLGNREFRSDDIDSPSAMEGLREVEESVAEWATGLTMQGKQEINRRQRFLDALARIPWSELLASAGLKTNDEPQTVADEKTSEE